MIVSVFGNPDVKEDSLAVRLVPRLRQRFPKIKFRVEDPVEGLNPPTGGEWVIIDMAKGIKGVRVIEDLDKLETARRVSLHDYDLAMELKLLRKLGKVKKVKIIAVEMGMRREQAFRVIASLL